MNNKGSLADIAFIGVVLLAFSMFVLIGFKISNEFNDKVQDMNEVPDAGKNAMANINSHFPGIMDNSALLLVIGLAVAAMFLAGMVRIHPVFFVFFILLLAIIVFICGIFSNIYTQMAANGEMVALAQQLVFTNQIMTYLPMLVGVLGFVLSIIMYKNWKQATL